MTAVVEAPVWIGPPVDPDVFARAANILTEVGWCKGELVNDAGNRCAAGALALATEEAGADHSDAWMFLYRLTGGPVGAWNDAPERTFTDVLALLARAEETARATQQQVQE